jgi:DNA ligase-1
VEFYADQDVSGWLASEKIDGVFACWGGVALLSKDGHVIAAPASLTANVGSGEGEIWHRDGLERVQGCLAWGADDARWTGVRFIPHASIPAQPVESAAQAYDIMERVVARGGEGVVLRNPASGEMLKLKPASDDEARVIGYTPGSGRNLGVGSLVLSWRGRQFKLSVGLSGRNRLNPPALGAHVTFSFDGLTRNGLPRNARFMRVRLAA